MSEHFGTYFMPGPTEVRAEVLQAMVQPMIPHRGAAFAALHDRVVQGLQRVFNTRRPVYLMTASATAMMEAAIRCAPPGPVLALVNGGFSERFARIAQACDRRARMLTVPWGESHDTAEVARALGDERYAAMTVVHVETSTGAVNDLRALADVAHRAGVACLADSVSGAGGMVVEADAWDLDFVFTGSQKALALPAGMAFGVASESFILQAGTVPNRGRYLDLVQFEEFAAKSQTPHTPALPVLYAADEQLRAIRAEGMKARVARHEDMRSLVERWVSERRVEGIEVDFLAGAGRRAATVSVLTLPPGVLAPDVQRRAAEHGFTIGTGNGIMRETTIRIGHMGDHRVEGLARCLDALGAALRGRSTHA